MLDLDNAIQNFVKYATVIQKAVSHRARFAQIRRKAFIEVIELDIINQIVLD